MWSDVTRGRFQRFTTAVANWVVTPRNARLIIAFWVIAFLISLTQIRHLTFGDPTAATPLLHEDSPYNLSHLEIQKYFGGIEPLIIVVEGRDKDVLKDPSDLTLDGKIPAAHGTRSGYRVQLLALGYHPIDQHDLL